MGMFSSATGSGGSPTPMKVVCTSCGAPLRLRPNKTVIFCEHCGTRNYFSAPVIRTPVVPSRRTPAGADTTHAVSAQPDGQQGAKGQSTKLRSMATFYLWGVGGVVLLLIFVAFVLSRI